MDPPVTVKAWNFRVFVAEGNILAEPDVECEYIRGAVVAGHGEHRRTVSGVGFAVTAPVASLVSVSSLSASSRKETRTWIVCPFWTSLSV